MTNKIFHLSTCDTCKRILKEIEPQEDTALIDIKKENIDPESLDFAYAKMGSYEALFNKRARKYRSENIKEQNPTDKEYRELILNEYTFLKRPLAIIDGEVYAGNAKKTIENLKNAIHG